MMAFPGPNGEEADDTNQYTGLRIPAEIPTCDRLSQEIANHIVIETMIRGWPSFYLDEDKDRRLLKR